MEYSPIKHIAKSLGHRHWRECVMSVITAYFDESNSGSASAVVGIIAEAGQLDHFSREWREMLDREHLTSFHMKDFAHSKEEFEGWKGDEARRRNLLSRVIGIISRRSRVWVGIVIDRSAYRKACSKSAPFREIYDTEYTTAGFLSLLKCTNWAQKQSVSGPIAFIFDDGNPQRPHFQRAFDLAKRTPFADEYQFGTLTFADDKLILPLQAADFIAYEVCKVYTDLASNTRRLRESLRRLITAVPSNCSVGTEEMLLRLADKFNALEGNIPRND